MSIAFIIVMECFVMNSFVAGWWQTRRVVVNREGCLQVMLAGHACRSCLQVVVAGRGYRSFPLPTSEGTLIQMPAYSAHCHVA